MSLRARSEAKQKPRNCCDEKTQFRDHDWFLLLQMRSRPPRLQLLASAEDCSAHATALPTPPSLCYNLRAVDRVVPDDRGRASFPADSGVESHPAEQPISFCPVCSERLEPKRCKLVCSKCGYYLSCSDYV
jgi:hypothetical protein